MRARINCTQCRKQMLKEATQAMQKSEYAFFKDSAYSFATYAICGVLTTLIRRGRSKQYINQMYNDMCMTFDTEEIFGQKIRMEDVMQMLTRDYNVDWSKLKVHVETEEHFLTSQRKDRCT